MLLRLPVPSVIFNPIKPRVDNMDSNYRRVNPHEHDSLDYRQSEFQRLLYTLFIYEKKFNIVELAEFLNRKPDTCYAYCEGELRLHVDDARRIVRFIASKDPKETRLVDYFINAAGLMALPRVDGKNGKKIQAILCDIAELTKKEE